MNIATQEITNAVAKLDIRKRRNHQTYDITLKEGQRIRFIDDEGCVSGELDVRNGKLYLMKHHSLKGHTWGGLNGDSSFGN
jgi:hypothetical protein